MDVKVVNCSAGRSAVVNADRESIRSVVHLQLLLYLMHERVGLGNFVY